MYKRLPDGCIIRVAFERSSFDLIERSDVDLRQSRVTLGAPFFIHLRSESIFFPELVDFQTVSTSFHHLFYGSPDEPKAMAIVG